MGLMIPPGNTMNGINSLINNQQQTLMHQQFSNALAQQGQYNAGQLSNLYMGAQNSLPTHTFYKISNGLVYSNFRNGSNTIIMEYK